MSWPADGVIARVDEVLAAYLDDRKRSLATVGPELAPVVETARAFVLDGGKRLRPSFAYWGWRCTHEAGDDDSGLIPAAAALELLHACALVHDDVMDASATRRGRPSAHAAFADLHRAQHWNGDADAFGTSAAILLGDLLLSWSDALFATAKLPSGGRAQARTVWDEMRQLVMAGQYLDVFVQARGQYSAQDALRVAMFKTSKYTVEGPLHFGAAAGEAPPATFEALSAYGIPLGEAFQLRDDVLGVFGDPELTGKPAGDDVREGKQTLLVAWAMEAADAAQAEVLHAVLGRRELSTEDVRRAREVIHATGALNRVEQRIAERCEQARAALRTEAILPDARAALDALAMAASQRLA